MNIALANDEYYFVGLWNTVLSMLASTPDASSLRIHVIDTGISDSSWDRLERAVAQHPRPPELLRKIFPRERLDGLDIPGPRSPLVYARLFLPELLDCKSVLYLDSDLLVFRNVLELGNVDLDGYACAAVINEDAGTLDFDLTKQEYTKLNLDPKSNYYNAGLLYMNLDYWREHNFTSKCLDFLKNHQFRLADQSAVNAVMNEKILPIDRKWNRLVSHLTAKEVASPDFVIHYTTRKPWLLNSDVPAMLLWRKFADDTGLTIDPPRQKPNLFERYILLNIMRTIGYGFLSLWYGLARKKRVAEGYSYAFSYWVGHAANRKVRSYEAKWAELIIDHTIYGPAWLLDGKELKQQKYSDHQNPIKGKRTTDLLRDRGRTREFISGKLQHKQMSRFEAILSGKRDPRVSGIKSDIPVSLTSWPPRERTLPLVLLSMIEQAVSPSVVHVWLSHNDQGMIKPRHKDFFAEHGVEFHTTEDIVPHKKWLPLIEMGHESPFVIIDDDTYYPRNWFDALITEGIQFPEEIVAHRCHKIKANANHMPGPYLEWEKDIDHENEASHYLFPTGCGGIMLRPEAISEDFRRRDLLMKLCPLADDVWLKAAYIQSGFKCRKSHYYFPCLDYPETRPSGLAVKNVDQGQNDQQIKAVFDYFDLKLD